MRSVATFVIAEIDEIGGRHIEAKDRLFEARKPYLAKQLELYSATTRHDRRGASRCRLTAPMPAGDGLSNRR